jgi:hypothetical protein
VRSLRLRDGLRQTLLFWKGVELSIAQKTAVTLQAGQHDRCDATEARIIHRVRRSDEECHVQPMKQPGGHVERPCPRDHSREQLHRRQLRAQIELPQHVDGIAIAPSAEQMVHLAKDVAAIALE